MIAGLTHMPLPDRFWVRVEKSDGCWLWTGSRMTHGYGVLTVNGRPIGAHRYSYSIANGPIADDVVIRHSCDNPPCVNPAHLLAGTQTDNVHDMLERGRHVTPFVRKEACNRGHKWTPETTRYSVQGTRCCKVCDRIRRDRKRGGPPVNHNLSKTHCPRGHEYSHENTRVRTKNGRQSRDCKTCQSDLQKIRIQRRRESQARLHAPLRGVA